MVTDSNSPNIALEGAKLKQMNTIKYLESIIMAFGESLEDLKVGLKAT